MDTIKEFNINPVGVISKEFLNHGVHTFHEACLFVINLPYKRNTDKENPKAIFIDKCGTCSTKHALLKQLRMEHDMDDIKLVIGVFEMNGINTPQILDTLTKYELEFIPEAHTYLKYQNECFDFTKAGSSPTDFMDYLMFEKEILPKQINKYKVPPK
ncbi:hypothetical protein [Sphingobacterium haloxyli]|uniref:Uncharacterized protein n=1 Tax=Sphingobacterium haloxyli TaxID=2100533 RepID=A0A2S9IZX4_9SPHI|nr:hypothetical protein [Sphingobacterium haloxyli]PRD46082.1 hypothetical protein C5745_16795 [Sphingobacterium haloxyli]